MPERSRDPRTELERPLAKVFEESGEGIVITDSEATILEVNEGYCAVMGYGRDEVVGQNPRITKSAVHGPEFYVAMWASLLETGRWQGEVWDRRKDGALVAKALSITAVRDEAGRTTHYVGIFREATRAVETDARLERLAHYDPLTGLPNGLLLRDRLGTALARATEDGLQVALLLLDLDRFREVNDTLGHRAGDGLLVAVSERLGEALPPGATLARLGGDEFVVVLPGVGTMRQVASVASELATALRAAFTVEGREVYVRASMGIAMFPFDARDVDDLLRLSDTALGNAKRAGRDQYRFYAPAMHAKALERLDLEAALRGGLAREELRVHYQPQVEAATGTIVGVEALVRWDRPGRGLLLPADFLPVAEECGALAAIDDAVLRIACAQGAAWLAAGLRPCAIGVNQSAARFRDRRLASSVARVLAETGLPPDRLCIELTESTVLADLETASRTLIRLSEMGVEVAMDDFGTGYSSLAYLKRLHVDCLKIPGSFVEGIAVDADDLALVEAVVAMARALGLRVVAEGVERPEQLAMLRERGCDVIQGHLFSPALPPEAAAAVLARGRL